MAFKSARAWARALVDWREACPGRLGARNSRRSFSTCSSSGAWWHLGERPWYVEGKERDWRLRWRTEASYVFHVIRRLQTSYKGPPKDDLMNPEPCTFVDDRPPIDKWHKYTGAEVPAVEGAVKWPHVSTDGQVAGSPDALIGPFYAIRKGKDKFRGVVLSKEEHTELMQDVKLSYGRRFRTLPEAMAFCLQHSLNSSHRFFAFRHGCKGARGLARSKKVFVQVLPRVSSRHIEKMEFSNMTQALVFCEQAGTSDTEWETLEGSIRFLGKNQFHDVDTLSLISKFMIRNAERDLPPTCPIQEKKIRPFGFLNAVKWPHKRLDEADETDSSTDPKGPFFVVQLGREKFRGIVLKATEYVNLIRAVRASSGSKEPRFSVALVKCMNPVRTPTKRGDHSWYIFLAFRYGLDGARGILRTRKAFKTVILRVEARGLEKAEFDNMTQALLFCEQAGTLNTDWQTLRSAVCFLEKNPEVDTPTMIQKYVIKNTEIAIPSGPAPLKMKGKARKFDRKKAIRKKNEALQRESSKVALST
ncbi:hypothetical protein FVE85_3614 [Porphyridium purpureum]|uniref:Uncharacterized protein n=1 Tax=Porphyridium purpureum TaxID=35688 RepID=A0A5J4YL76_PORPP|nr:hypothetical protein FVE85_3614 [Porphyridium purpureum]|eukprot:POR7108..scf249_10